MWSFFIVNFKLLVKRNRIVIRKRFLSR